MPADDASAAGENFSVVGVRVKSWRRILANTVWTGTPWGLRRRRTQETLPGPHGTHGIDRSQLHDRYQRDMPQPLDAVVRFDAMARHDFANPEPAS